MQIGKFLGVLIIALSVFFLGLQFKGMEAEAAGIRALTVALLTILYYVSVKKRHTLFAAFLITFTVSEIFNYFTWNTSTVNELALDYYYYIGNCLYILSYLLLSGRILMPLEFKKAVGRFPIQTGLLILLGLFFVYFVSDTTRAELDTSQYTLELMYNAVVMFLMTVALINYMYKDDNKSMNLLIGTICIMFSEVIQLAYFYISDLNLLNVLCSLFLVFAFLFFYLQSLLEYREARSYISSKVEAKTEV
ncbi:MAG: hypothetical protein HRU26_09310 [Psychroserpens sp.]|nr:hypothetical protein [Psychroserpens sp.]